MTHSSRLKARMSFNTDLVESMAASKLRMVSTDTNTLIAKLQTYLSLSSIYASCTSSTLSCRLPFRPAKTESWNASFTGEAIRVGKYDCAIATYVARFFVYALCEPRLSTTMSNSRLRKIAKAGLFGDIPASLTSAVIRLVLDKSKNVDLPLFEKRYHAGN